MVTKLSWKSNMFVFQMGTGADGQNIGWNLSMSLTKGNNKTDPVYGEIIGSVSIFLFATLSQLFY